MSQALTRLMGFAALYPSYGPSTVIASDKREAFAQGSEATKQSIHPLCRAMDCFASLAMTRMLKWS
jgi:hypothetical protein